MKKYLFPLVILTTLFITSCEEKINIEKEEKAIKAVLEAETDAFLNRDFDRLASYYIQDESNVRLSASKTGYSYYADWEEIGALFKEYFENNPGPSSDKYVKTNYRIKVYKESAWTINDETVYNSEGEISTKMIGVRFLEKVNGEWKIAYLGVVNTTSYEEDDTEVEGEPETEDTE